MIRSAFEGPKRRAGLVHIDSSAINRLACPSALNERSAAQFLIESRKESVRRGINWLQ